MVQLSNTRCCSMALWLAALLLCPGAAAVRPHAGGARISSSRADAFIGYQEDAAADCRDRLPEECQLQASKAGCLQDPFMMRAMCQLSCGTGACRDQRQAHRRRMRGRASAYGTWTYAKAFRRAVARNHYIEVDLLKTHKFNNTLLLSSLGHGTYLADADASTDEAVICATLYSITHGWNVIDTGSSHVSKSQGSHAEAAVGRALEALLVGSSAHDFSQPIGPAVADTDAQLRTEYMRGTRNRWLDDAKGSTSRDDVYAIDYSRTYQGSYSKSGCADASTSGSSGRTGINSGAVGLEQLQLLRAQRAKISADVASMAPDITRDMLFISTKAGFVSKSQRKALLSSGKVRSSDFVGGHCMHPECLKASLLQSLERLGLEMVDVLYVHNPAEAQLEHLGRAAFMERLKAAFVALEAMRKEGLLGVYGLATWDCFRVPPTSEVYLSLQDVVALAVEAGGKSHGFMAVQLPINAAIPEAWSQPWQHSTSTTGQAAGVTLMEAAGKLGVRVLASEPLMEGKLLSRPALQLDAIPSLATLPSEATKLLQLSRSTPGLTSALVGHKWREHVEANHEVSMEPRLAAKRFKLVHQEVAHVLALAGASNAVE